MTAFIASWEGDSELLQLRVDCQYLAKRIDPAFDHFILELQHITYLEFDCWTGDRFARTLADPRDIFRGLPEFNHAEVKDGIPSITCYVSDPELNHTGGTLLIQCHSIRLFDAAMREMTTAQLRKIADSYWNDFAARNSRSY